MADRAYHYFLEGRTLARRGYVQAAIETLELACKLAQREGGYQLALAKLLRESGEPRGAVMHLRFAYETGTEPVREQAFKLLDELGYPAEPEEPAPVPVSAFANKGRPRPSTASGAAAYETTH